MNLDREHLLSALKAAELVVTNDSKIEIFTKLWLLADKVLAFNATGTVIHVPIELPPLGGLDGKTLIGLLEKSSEDEVTIELEGDGTAKVVLGKLRATLRPLDPTPYIKELSTPPTNSANVCSLETELLFENLELTGLLQVKLLKHDPSPAFSSLTLKGRGDKLWLYTCDRAVLNRSMLTVSQAAENEYQQLLPLHFLRVLAKLHDHFNESELAIDTKTAVVTNQDGAVLYTKLGDPKAIIDMQTVLDRWWPNGYQGSKVAFPIPDNFGDVIARAEPFATNELGLVTLKSDGKRLTISTHNPKGDFTEELAFKHPAQSVTIPHKRLKVALKYVDKIHLNAKGVALFGPKRFAHFISGDTLSRYHGDKPKPEVNHDDEPPF